MSRALSVVGRILVTGICVLMILLLTSCREVFSAGSAPISSYPTVTLATGLSSPVLPSADIPRITPTEVWQRMQAGEPITIVDARAASAYQIEHIVGAINLPAAEVEQRWTELPRDGLLIFYCG